MIQPSALLGLLCIISTVASRSMDSLVTSSPMDSRPSTTTPKQYVQPEIYDMRVDTNVSNRYAKTLITSKVRNIDINSQEAVFSIITPDKAFISGFVMEIDGKQYPAYVKEKEEAKKTYKHAVSQGRAAAHVAASARDSHRFTVSVNLEPESKAIFYLTYEELLERRDETYEVVLNINPGQLVDLKVQVNISEARPLKFVKVPSLRTGNEADKNAHAAVPQATIENINSTSAVVTFSPDKTTQESLGKELGTDKKGIQGQFVVQYDVERDPQGGEVLISGGYFVHFFAPEKLPPLKKQVIFVLDTSGSMGGSRISQLKQAMNSILDELKAEDTLSIIEFNSIVNAWNIPLVEGTHKHIEYRYGEWSEEEVVPPPPVAATPENINKSKEVVSRFTAGGGTEILGALEVALKVALNNSDNNGRLPMIIFLTDGEANGRISDSEIIVSMITKQNTKRVPIYSLSFGDGAKRDFLRKLSLKNQGFQRHIYEAADSFLQLQNFYTQISSPLLSNVTFKYVDKVTNVTRTHFPILHQGGELITAGRIEEIEFDSAEVEGNGPHGSIKLKPTVLQTTDSLERLWAYLTVKLYLEERVVRDNSSYTDKALELSLKYSFVTDVTSLVVVKPNASTAVETEDATRKSPKYPGYHHQSSRLRGSFLVQSVSRQRPVPVPIGYSSGYSSSSNSRSHGPRRSSHYSGSKNIIASRSSFDDDWSTRGDPVIIQNPANNSQPVSLPSWLKGNDNITLDSKTYSLGNDMNPIQGQSCLNSIDNKNGTCTLIFKCPSMYSALVDLDALKTHFCEVASMVAGVCCPVVPIFASSTTIKPLHSTN